MSIVPSRKRQVSKIAVRHTAKVALACRIDCDGGAEKAAAPPATPRHPNHSLPLLPSGPGGVCELSSRGDRRGHHRRGLLSPDTDGLDPLGTLQVGGESGIRTRDTYYRIHTFQACSFNHSDTSPLATNNNTDDWMRDCSAHPEPHPSLARGASLRLSKFVPDKFVEPAIRITVYTLSRRAPSTTRTPLRMGETASAGQATPAKKRKDSVRFGYRQAESARIRPRRHWFRQCHATIGCGDTVAAGSQSYAICSTSVVIQQQSRA